jgi:hypothetical protein
MASNKRPVQDLGVPKPKVPFRAGGKRQVTSKAELFDTGTVGFTPGSGYRPDMHMEEAPQQTGRVPGSGDLEYAPQARPHPRDIPVYDTPSHGGTIRRFLDGHSEIHRARPELVELANNPHVHPDDRKDAQAEIAYRDALHTHKFW